MSIKLKCTLIRKGKPNKIVKPVYAKLSDSKKTYILSNCEFRRKLQVGMVGKYLKVDNSKRQYGQRISGIIEVWEEDLSKEIGVSA